MQASDFIRNLQNKAHKLGRSLALPESYDPRVLIAAHQLLSTKSLKSIHLFGDPDQVMAIADNSGHSLLAFTDQIHWCQPKDLELAQQTLAHCQRRAAKRGKTLSSAESEYVLSSPLDQAAYLLAQGNVDAVVAGCVSSTAEVIRAALRGVGLLPGCQTISGSFAMIRETVASEPLHYLFGDCGVVIDPSIEQLVDIASATVATFQSLFPEEEPIVAFLSFSTYGSALHPFQKKMADAAAVFKQKFPDLKSDGELQFDAAINPSVNQRKAPGSPIAGQANCFIFPDLNAGNIAYKITQRLGGFAAYGPILQGTAKPYNDLSRGASAEDIAVAGLIAMLRASAH